MKNFSGKVAFITGGASGLGLGLAKVFSEAGCKIVIADIREANIDQALAHFKDKSSQVHAIHLDITDRKAYASAADEVERIFGEPPRLLFNNAGVNTFGPTEYSTYEDWDWVMGVNMWGVVNGMQTFVPRMIAAGRTGHIVSTASLAGFQGGPRAAIYSASKAAVINMMESYRLSLKPYGIGVSVCCPANIKSNIAESPLNRPDHLKNTGYLVTRSAVDAQKMMYAAGMEPVELAQHVKKAIEEDRLYIIAYPESRGMLEMHFQGILDAVLPEESDREGMKKRTDAMKKWRENPGEGFAQANPDAQR